MALGVAIILWLILWQLLGQKAKDMDLWNFLITPLLLTWGAQSFLLFVESELIKHAVIITAALLVWFFINNIFLYRFRPQKYQAYSLENISNYINIIAFWFWFTSLFGFIILIDLSLWYLLPAAFVITAVLYYQMIWINKLEIKELWPYALVISVIAVEAFWAMSFWPTGFYVNGVVITTLYYFLAGLSRLHILGNLDKKSFLRHLAFSLIILIIILITAQWR